VINEEDELIEADIKINENVGLPQEMQAPSVIGQDKKQVRAAFLERPPN